MFFEPFRQLDIGYLAFPQLVLQECGRPFRPFLL